MQEQEQEQRPEVVTFKDGETRRRADVIVWSYFGHVGLRVAHHQEFDLEVLIPFDQAEEFATKLSRKIEEVRASLGRGEKAGG